MKHQGAGFILTNPHETEFVYALKYNFHESNNEPEYEALYAGLGMALAINVDQLIIHGDSQIVHVHVTGMFAAKEANMRKYSKIAKKLLS